MDDPVKTKDELICELTALRKRVDELEERNTRFREREEAFIDLFNATEELAFLQELNGTVVLANNCTAVFYGISREDIVGRSIYEFIFRDKIESARKRIQTVIDTQKTVRFEGTLGEKVFENSLYPVLDRSGNVCRVAVYVRDITERKRLEEAVRQAEEKYRVIFENAIEGIFQISREGRFISANPALARIHGYDSPEELIAVITDIPHQLSVNTEDMARLVRLLSKKDSVEGYQIEMVKKDGRRHWVRINVRTVRNENRRILYYEGTMLDITGRKQAMAQIRESEERYRTVIEHSNDGISINRGDRPEYVNKRFVEMFGYDSPEDIIGKHVTIIVHPDDHAMVTDINQRRQRGEPVPSRYEFKGIRKDGSVIYVEVSATSLLLRGAPVSLINLRDVTKRKIAEEAIKSERNRFQTLSDNAPFGIMVIDEKGTFTYLNPKFTELFGYDLHDVPNGMEWYKKAFPDIKEREVAIAGWINDVKNTQPGERMARVFTIACKDGSKKSVNFIPVRLATGEYLVSLDDITERIQAQQALIESHKQLESLNRAKTKAVNHISHELKTPLAVIQGHIRILKRKLAATSANVSIENILSALERNLERLFSVQRETNEIFSVTQEVETTVLLDDIERLWERIGDLSSLPPDVLTHLEAVKEWIDQYRTQGIFTSAQSIDLYPFISQLVDKAKQAAGDRKITFRVEGENDLYVATDPLMLSEVVETLLKNAIENTPDGSLIAVSVEHKRDRIWLHVTDYGIGIREENQPYLFDGLFHTEDTDLYSSRRPYEFGAGGKGLELLRTKVYGQRFGFDISMKSKRCTYLPTDEDLCPGDVAQCRHITGPEGCLASGGTTFSVAFPVEKRIPRS